MKLNSEQIIKGLECCLCDTRNTSLDCDTLGCPYYKLGEDCISNIMTDTLSLIKELTKENERMRERCVVMIEDDDIMEFVMNIPEELLGHPDPVGESGECGLKRKCQANTVQKMQAMIKEECIAGGIWPAFVARVVERVGNKILEDKG